ncbi:cyclically-permuted mutarotase family protein [Parabacteroides sp. OttesenSCG-928-G06]|nr:cyclically-permuted mutarotase family protein [Parabacteroides sp. OttesenSCG-928-G06]
MLQAQQVKVACVGNSVTYGAGVDNREVNCYPAQLQRLLGDGYEVKNFGRSGATLLTKGHRPYIEQEEYRQALDFAADRVIIHLGLNDTDPRNWPNYRDEFVKNYIDLIDSFRRVNPECRIWICRMTPITHAHARFKSGTRDWYWQIQEAIERIAVAAGTGLIDLQEPLYPRPDLLPDALHPDATGAGIIASVVYSALTGDYGGLQMASVYSDNMVLQQGEPLRLQGRANAGERIRVTIGYQQQEAVTGADGKWSVTLSPLQVGPALTLEVASPTRTLRFENVAVGEVWLCSGQSNMAFMVRESVKAEVDEQLAYAATQPDIRMFDMKPLWLTNAVEWDKSVMDSLNNLHYYKETNWQMCDAANARHTSAVAFAFARMLTERMGVPVGLILNAVGGSPAEAWIDRKTLEFDFPDILSNWTRNDFIQPWVRERAAQNIRRSEIKGQRHPYEPVYLFESGILPLQQYPVKGVLWYQGESNAHNIEAHERLFPLLVQSWRNYWAKELPFYYVQLSGINRPSWPHFRDSQRRMMREIPGVGMAVSSDRGDSLDVHPRYKREIGERLARWALHKTYGFALTPSGPLVKSATAEERFVWVTFDYGDGLATNDGKGLRTFEVAGEDCVFHPAAALVENDRLRVWSERVKQPRYVRYGWQPFTRANLVNGEGLPASTFCIEIETNNKKDTMKWNKLTDLPGTATTASLGVSAPFTAVWNDRLIVAGGCNFPDKPVTEGGAKRYYDEIFALNLQDKSAKWEMIGRLPRQAAYGAAVATPEGIVCMGGNNNEQALKDVFLLVLNDKNETELTALPSLPAALDNFAAAAIGSVVYVAGGNAGGKPSNGLYSLDLKKKGKGWKKEKAFPGVARVQPVLVAQNNGKETLLYLAGGFSPVDGDKAAEVPTNMLVYSPSAKRWSEETALPPFADGSLRTLTGGCGVAGKEHLIYFMGGVNRDRFLAAVDRPRRMEVARAAGDKATVETLHAEAAAYMHHPVEWYAFNKELLAYDTLTKSWEVLGTYEQLARAGAGAVLYNHQLIIVNGELKPGIRTPQVNLLVMDEE